MSIDMTIKGGTTRTIPQKGDDGLHGEVTSWMNDVTTAVNTTPSLSEAPKYEAVVGSAADVTAGIATHSDIATAIAAVSANDRIFLLDNTFEPSAQIEIDKALTITGQGEGAVIEGDNLATGAVVKISASGVTLENFKIIQGSGTPAYALEIAAATERCNLDLKADGTFSTALYLDGSTAGSITGFISYDNSSAMFGGILNQVKLKDQTTPAFNTILQSDSDATPLDADRTLTFDLNNAARILDMAANLFIGAGYSVTITAEDTAGSIVLDKQTVEFEGEQTATRLMKFINGADAAATLTISGTAGSVDQDVTSGSSPAFTSPALTTPVLTDSVSGTAFLDEDDMSSNSATKLSSQQAIKAFVDSLRNGQVATNTTNIGNLQTDSHVQDTDTGTTSNTFAVGDNLDTDKTFEADNGDANNPKIRYVAASNQWEFSNDGLTFNAIGTGASELKYPTLIQNAGLTFAVGAGAATITLKQSDGSTDPDGSNPVKLGFRHSTITNGAFNIVSATTAISAIIPSGALMGFVDATQGRIFVYGLNNAGTVELAFTGFKKDESVLHTTVALSSGSDDRGSLYSTTLRTDQGN